MHLNEQCHVQRVGSGYTHSIPDSTIFTLVFGTWNTKIGRVAFHEVMKERIAGFSNGKKIVL